MTRLVFPRRAKIVAGTITLAVLGIGGSATISNSSDTTSFTFAATADTWANAGSPTQTYGSSTKLHADGNPTAVAYVHFDVSGLTAPVASATLVLTAQSNLTSGVEVRAVADHGWSEATLDAQNAPSFAGDVAASSGPLQAGTSYNLDVTSLVSGDGPIDLAITDPSSTAVALSSRESGNGPKLVVQLQGGGTSAPSTSGSTPSVTSGATTTTTVPSTTTPATTTVATSPAPTPVPLSGGPIRAAFYYPWFPSAWNQQGMNPFTHYHPSLGFYDEASPSVIAQQVRWMRDAGLDAMIASWWSPGSNTDLKIPTILSVLHSLGLPFKLSLYYEAGAGVPAPATLASDFDYIYSHYASDPSFLHVDGKPVLFVYNSGSSGTTCSAVPAFESANAGRFYLDLKVFSGFRTCPQQPEGWHQYGPATAESSQKGYSFTISPGFYKANESTPRLARDPARWLQDVKDMVASNAPWQLVATFNEWGEGTAVEPAGEWSSASGAGVYLDELGQVIRGADPPPATTTTTPTITTPTTTTTLPTVTSTTGTTTTVPTTPAQPPDPSDPVIAAAGDIACSTTDGGFKGGLGTTSVCREKWTSDLLLNMQNLKAVLPLGDAQYECGDTGDFAGAYDPTWGRLKSITHWATGNHEYGQSCGRNDNSPANAYFGSSNSRDWYSYNVGSWHLIVLNSECSYGTGATKVGGCGAGSAEETWLLNDLASHQNACTLAYWHEPRFSSGQHGDALSMATIWNDLVAAHVDVVLSGHNHDYERFEPIGATPAKQTQPVLDPNGIREFVVGTGGKNHYGFSAPPLSGEMVRDSTTFGVLKLTLHPNGYDWSFVNDPGSGSFTDSGSGACH